MKLLTHLTRMWRVALLAALVPMSCVAFAAPSHVASLTSPMVAPAPTASAPHPANAELGTSRAPLVVQAVQVPDGREARADEVKRRAWEIDNANRAHWLGVIMAVIAVFQLILFTIQLRMMGRNIRDTANAARAAELNAKAAIGIELPFLRAIPSDLLTTSEPVPEKGPYGGYVNDGPPTAYNVLGPIEIANLGRTPAYSLVVSIGWIVARVLSEQPPAYRHTIRMNHNMVLAAGAETNFHPHFCIALSKEEVKETARDEKWLWIFGEIAYRDFMDQKQTARFCWRFANRNPPGDLKLYYLSGDGEPPTAYIQRTTTINA